MAHFHAAIDQWGNVLRAAKSQNELGCASSSAEHLVDDKHLPAALDRLPIGRHGTQRRPNLTMLRRFVIEVTSQAQVRSRLNRSELELQRWSQHGIDPWDVIGHGGRGPNEERDTVRRTIAEPSAAGQCAIATAAPSHEWRQEPSQHERLIAEARRSNCGIHCCDVDQRGLAWQGACNSIDHLWRWSGHRLRERGTRRRDHACTAAHDEHNETPRL